MGQCGSREEPTPEQLAQAELDKKVQTEIEEAREGTKRHKVLLLGAGSSGKSTFYKQLCQIHGSGFSDDDKVHGARYIHESILIQMGKLIETCVDDFKYEISSDAKESLDFMTEFKREKITPEIVKHIKILWKDASIQRTFENRTNLGIADSCPYFFAAIDRIGVDDYEPTEQDILLARIPTTGIREASFVVQGSTFELFDVGGQRSERSKWIHCFDTVDAILYVASLNCYDQKLFEDEDVNAMDESVDLFNEVVNSRFFKKVLIILFLNKADLFAEKIQTKPLTIWDENYAGKANDFDEGVEYIREVFKRQYDGSEAKTIYAHVTTATNRENVQKVFDDVQHGIVMGSLSTNGLL